MAKKLTDLTGDGKVTQADVLKGRGVFKAGGMAKKGYKKGGKIKMPGSGAATKGFYSRGPMG
jgi:ribosome-associated protein YbcJ (S4-like RNA binding protein)